MLIYQKTKGLKHKLVKKEKTGLSDYEVVPMKPPYVAPKAQKILNKKQT
jgi:hypothetical protein